MKTLKILYKDRYLLAVDKPSGLLSVPGRGPEKADCAVSRAAAEFGWVREVHRLDQPTSGILLMARTPEAHRTLSEAFAAREIDKTYMALTTHLPEDPGRKGVFFKRDGNSVGSSGYCRIRLFQRLDPKNRPYQIIDSERGKEAVTEWRQRESSRNELCGVSLYSLELKPRTGRTHQLRLALSVCGAAIPGDTLYAPEKIRNLSPRLLLHAAEISFPHPENRRDVTIKAGIPFRT